MYSVCILNYVYMYLCIYIATHLQTVYQDWLQAVLESHSRCPWEWWPSELRDTLRGCDWASEEMHLEAVIQRIWRYNWMPWLSEFGAMHLEAVIEGVWRYTWRRWSSEFGDAPGGHNRASCEIHLEAVMERDWTCTWRRSMYGTPGTETLFSS